MKEHLLAAGKLVAPRVIWTATVLGTDTVEDMTVARGALTGIAGEAVVEGIFEYCTRRGAAWWRAVEGNPPDLFIEIRKALNPTDHEWRPPKHVIVEDEPEVA